MSAVISLNDRRATIENGVWSVEGRSAAATAWATLLNDMTPQTGVSPTVGRADVWLARRAVKWLAARGERAVLVGFSLEILQPGRVY